MPGERGVRRHKDSERVLKKAAKKRAKLDVDGSDKLEQSKKRKSHDGADADAEVVPKKHKKSKRGDVVTAAEDVVVKEKSKKIKESTAATELTGVTSKDEEAARQERKRRRKEKKAREAEEVNALGKESKQKTEKQAKKSSKEKEATRVASKAKPVASTDQWNPDALTGDAARKNKFLRLLGAGKGSSIETYSKSKQQAGVQDIQKVESELERQFAVGVRMKHDGQGKRRGLGM